MLQNILISLCIVGARANKELTMKLSLYIITFPNNKKYVGITTNFSARKNKHKNRAKKSKYNHLKIYRAINKYGFDNLQWSVDNNYSTWDELNKSEINIISKLKTNLIEFGYNSTAGGEGHLGFSPSKETRDKISKANKGKIISDSQKQFLSLTRMGKNNPMYGRPTSKKQKEAASKASKGEKNINSKLTNKQATEIRNKYKSGDYLIIELAKEYNLNKNTVSKLLKNKSYVDLEYSITIINFSKKLTFAQAQEIRKLYSTNNYTQKEIAGMFNVSFDTIFRIIHNKTYKS